MGAWEVEVESVGACDAYYGNMLLECWGLWCIGTVVLNEYL
jgi:hypothetical protein